MTFSFAGLNVTSASAALKPFFSSAVRTATKSLGAVTTSMLASSLVMTSSAPASIAASISLSSSVPGAKMSCPQCLDRNATEP
ncbi:hypothetical protein D3C83_74440 [compost metagenome]